MAGDRLSLTRLNRDSTWSSERIAQELVPLRDRLVERLSHEIAAARDLTLDQRELVIDDAIDFLVTQYVKPVRTREELDRAFWAAASYRVKRAFEGRSATVRGGYRRVDLEDLDRIAAGEDPEEAVVRRDERLTLLEFAATLSPRERKVLACKYGNGREVLGRKLISRALGLPIGEVRKAEREIARKLERFAALVAAGSLCSFRGRVILSLAASTASDDEAAAARLHLKRCPACRRVYAARLRAMRTGEFQRELAGLLPVPVVERLAEERPLRWPVIDWLSRPFSGDGTAVAAQAASTGTGRGLGAVAAVKLASLCIGGAALTGGAAVCIQQIATPSPPANDRAHRSSAERHGRRDDPRCRGARAPPEGWSSSAASNRPRRRTGPRPQARSRRTRNHGAGLSPARWRAGRRRRRVRAEQRHRSVHARVRTGDRCPRVPMNRR